MPDTITFADPYHKAIACSQKPPARKPKAMSKDTTTYPRRRIVADDPFACVFSYADIMACEPCYDPVEAGVLPSKRWRGTLEDIARWPARKFPADGSIIKHSLTGWSSHMGQFSDQVWAIERLLMMLPSPATWMFYKARREEAQGSMPASAIRAFANFRETFKNKKQAA